MSEEGGAMASATDHEYSSHNGQQPIHLAPHPPITTSRKSTLSKSQFDVHLDGTQTPMSYLGENRGSRHLVELDEYFVGPRNLDAHSKLPYFMRLHGSVLPRMILPLTLVGAWATLITCLAKFVHKFNVSTILLTVLGFVVGLALSFRSTTAYERYSDGRKSWATLSVQCRNLARYIWVHIDERAGEAGKDDLLAKLTALNLIHAFAVSLKHRLRFEPYAHYPDLNSLVSHLDTFAKAAYSPEVEIAKKKTPWKAVGEYLGLSFASSNPRKSLKRATRPVGNLPLEILTYLSSYFDETSINGTMKSPIIYGQIMTSLAALSDTMSSAERVLSTPLPVGYNILISQIVLLYVYLLPFQLIGNLDWLTIPGTIAAAYIILGLAAIGNELENPFGNDVNDLPLDQYCDELRRDLDTISSGPAVKYSQMLANNHKENKVLWPLSMSGYGEWKNRSIGDIRSALRAKPVVGTDHPLGEQPRSSSGTTLGS